MHLKTKIVAALLIFCVGCASQNKPTIDLIQGEQFGFSPDDKAPEGKFIWFTQDAWEKTVHISVQNIKKTVAP